MKNRDINRIKEIVRNNDSKEFLELENILLKSNNFEVIDIAALAIMDLNYKEGVKALMSRIKDIYTLNHKSTLLYACSEFDCTSYINVLIDIVISGKYQAGMEALHLIKNNCQVNDREEIFEIVNKLKHQRTDNDNNENEGLIDHLINYFKGVEEKK